jgi:hypothetical protein
MVGVSSNILDSSSALSLFEHVLVWEYVRIIV